ncbi:MAG: hypothetical protein ABMA15_24060 [Vicinamibacterales bacterium]
MKPTLLKKNEDKDIVVHLLSNLYRVVENPIEEPVDGVAVPLYWEEPVTAEQAAIKAIQLKIDRDDVKVTKGKPWTLYRILLTLFYAHGQIEDVEKLNHMSKLRKRIRDAETNKIEVIDSDIKFIRELTKKLAESKRMPAACWEVLEEELVLAESTSAKDEVVPADKDAAAAATKE